MIARTVGRWFSMVFLLSLCALAASSCGTTNESVFHDAGVSIDTGFVFFDGSLNDATLTSNTCTPRTCADRGYNCGPNGDGCGGLISSCGTCTAPDFCGGGGFSLCGTSPPSADAGVSDGGDAGSSCVPQTCEELGFDCGLAVDRCQNVLLCGAGPDGGAITLATGVDAGAAGQGACPAPGFCGGAGPNRCGGDVTLLPDGAVNSQCVPQVCPAGANCGKIGDGCGNVVTCGGTCTSPQFCGGGGGNICGGNNAMLPDGGSTCVPQTCASLGYNCGPAGDGCGGVIQCGTSCPAPQFCGGGGPSKCGGNVNVTADGAPVDLCVPTTCAAQHVTCGQTGDGCGNLLSCGSCTLPDTCGGGGVAGACGHVCVGDGGLCGFQTCTNGTPTTITGHVFSGRSTFLNPSPATTAFPPDPVPNVLVYVPNGAVLPFAPGTACRQCGADVSGSPLVSTYTNFDGSFTLTGVPVPPSTTIPLVIQLGRWRREFTITTPPACTTSLVAPTGGTAGVLNLPRNHTEGDIPLTAVSTGNVDALECVLLKMGVDRAEFTSSTPPAGTASGRIHVYAGTTGNNASSAGATVPNANPETSLMGTGGSFMGYDQILFPCWGGPATKTAAELANLVSYADNGGHFFTTHYSYSWLVGNGEFNGVANWDIPAGTEDADNPGNVTWTLNVSLPPPVVSAPLHPGIFYQWLNYVCALSNSSGTCNPFNANPAPAGPQVAIFAPRFDADSVANGSVDWIDGTDQNRQSNVFGDPLVEHFTFNTPVGSQNQCGHAIYSDFHVANITTAFNVAFPTECSASFTPQEKILEYMLFDLASCVAPPPPITCQPVSCAQQGLSCGPTGDGCGHTINCGPCAPPLTCGGGGVRGVCGEPDGGACTPLGCANRCGPQGDGCGGEINCPCPAGTTCGGAGVPDQCGTPGSCVPRTCAQQGIACGPAGDGCGNLIAGGCGVCPAGTICGAGGVPAVCAAPDGGACVPQTCAQQGIACGPAGDGCGDVISSCGACVPPQTCGGGGVPGQCGNVTCVPTTCAALDADCGPVGDGCGGLLACGDCPPGQFCGANGRPNVCGANIPK